MRRLPLVPGTILLVPLVTSVARLPALACRRGEDAAARLADRLPPTGRFTCGRREPDANGLATVAVRGRWAIARTPHHRTGSCGA